jgi:type I restriction enzyme S subunit
VSAVREDGFHPEENKVVRDRGLFNPTICVHDGDLLITRANTAQLVGRSCIAENVPPGLMLCDKTLRLRVDERIIPTKYVHMALSLPEVRRQIEVAATGTSGSMKNISQQSIRRLMIPIGSPETVARFVEILDSVDEQIQTATHLIAKLRDLRVASIRRLAGTGLACFHGIEAFELHRSGRRSNGSWSLVPLGSVLIGIDAGHSPDLEDTPAGSGQWGVLKVSAVGEDGFRPEENKLVGDRGLCNRAFCVSSGDLLMTRANTSQLVGRTCIVQYAPPRLMLCDKTLRLKVNERLVPTRYVHIVLELAELRRQIEIAATGTSSSMKNISQKSIRQLMIPVGSPEDMRYVVELDSLHEAQISALRREAEGLHLLKQGLIDDLLTGRVPVSIE